MSTGKSVQFHTLENVLNAYQLRDVPAFAIYQGTQLMVKYEGKDIDEGSALLEQFLQMLQNSAAIYSLCVYEEFTGKISNKSAYHGSWNFRFNQITEGAQQGNFMLQSVNDKLSGLSSRLDALSAKQIAEELEGEDDPQSKLLSGMDRIGEILGHPLVERFIPVILSAFKISPDELLRTQQQLQAPAAMAGVNGAVDTLISANVLQAVTFMLQASKETEGALIQLGEIAAENPAHYKKLLGYIKLL